MLWKTRPEFSTKCCGWFDPNNPQISTTCHQALRTFCALRTNSLQNASTSLQNASTCILYKMRLIEFTNLYKMRLSFLLSLQNANAPVKDSLYKMPVARNTFSTKCRWWVFFAHVEIFQTTHISLQNAGPFLYKMSGCERKRVFPIKWPADFGPS